MTESHKFSLFFCHTLPGLSRLNNCYRKILQISFKKNNMNEIYAYTLFFA